MDPKPQELGQLSPHDQEMMKSPQTSAEAVGIDFVAPQTEATSETLSHPEYSSETNLEVSKIQDKILQQGRELENHLEQLADTDYVILNSEHTAFRRDIESVCRHAFTMRADIVFFLDKSARFHGLMAKDMLPVIKLEYCKAYNLDPDTIPTPEIKFINPATREYNLFSYRFKETIKPYIQDKKVLVYDESTASDGPRYASDWLVGLSSNEQYNYFTNDKPFYQADNQGAVDNPDEIQTRLDRAKQEHRRDTISWRSTSSSTVARELRDFGAAACTNHIGPAGRTKGTFPDRDWPLDPLETWYDPKTLKTLDPGVKDHDIWRNKIGILLGTIDGGKDFVGLASQQEGYVDKLPDIEIAMQHWYHMSLAEARGKLRRELNGIALESLHMILADTTDETQ